MSHSCLWSRRFPNLGFRKFDYENAPSSQLFRFDADGKIRSHLDESKCLVLNHGDALVDGVRVRLADCERDTRLNKFSLDAESKHLKPNDDPSFCVTNKGRSPQNGDTIHLKPCEDRGDHKWTFLASRDVPECKCADGHDG